MPLDNTTRAAITQARNLASTYWSIWASMPIPERVVLAARIELGRDWLEIEGRTVSEIEQGRKLLVGLEAQYADLIMGHDGREAKLYDAWRAAENNFVTYEKQYKDLVKEAGEEPLGAVTLGRPGWAERREIAAQRASRHIVDRQTVLVAEDGASDRVS